MSQSSVIKECRILLEQWPDEPAEFEALLESHLADSPHSTAVQLSFSYVEGLRPRHNSFLKTHLYSFAVEALGYKFPGFRVAVKGNGEDVPTYASVSARLPHGHFAGIENQERLFSLSSQDVAFPPDFSDFIISDCKYGDVAWHFAAAEHMWKLGRTVYVLAFKSRHSSLEQAIEAQYAIYGNRHPDSEISQNEIAALTMVVDDQNSILSWRLSSGAKSAHSVV